MTLNKVVGRMGRLHGAARVDDGYRIATARAAAILRRPTSRRILLALARQERSLSELAAATGMSLTLVHYHVARMQALDLVEATTTARGLGRPLKRYRAVARAFHVPSHLADGGPGRALMRELNAGLERDRARDPDAGVTISVDAAGKPRMTRVSPAAGPQGLELWSALSLSREQARTLSADLSALFARYAAASVADGRSFIAYCAFTERGA